MTQLVFTIPNYDAFEYIFFPACIYNGNRFRSLKKEYPPCFSLAEAGVDVPVTITDVPRLAEDGSGTIEVTTGDVSVPCMGMFSKERQMGMLIFTVQQINGENLMLSFSDGCFAITYPERRKQIYQWPFMRENTEDASSDIGTVEIPHRVLEFPCKTMRDFFHVFFLNRKIMGLDAERPVNISRRQQWDIQRQKFNQQNYDELFGYNADLSQKSFGLGWCGTGMSSYAMMRLGEKIEWERGVKTLEFLFGLQGASGFFPGVVGRNGAIIGDGFKTPGTENWHLIRRSADMLYFIFKHFDLYQQRGIVIPEPFINGARRLADAFVRLWNRYGQIGQFVDYKTGDLVVGNSTCGAIVPAGLARASVFFDEPNYLDTAKAIAKLYLQRDALNGFTTGGPGEILQCPDSESAFGLLESMVVLYDVTGEKRWLDSAEFLAWFCSSWVVAYNYHFPAGCEFERLGIKTVGTVFANVQNKHSAPGICTLSGDSLYRLYQWTGNSAYKELILEIACAISQCMSTEERPVYSWPFSKDPTLSGQKMCPPERLPAGFICERVNMSDWETKACIGGVFNGSCWCETSNLLTLAELPDAFMTDNGIL